MTGISSAVPPIKVDANGNVLSNINAQNITPNAVATNVKTDANGNVLANLNAQNITPSATASNVKLDANGNVLANINAQNINPNIANPYAPQLLSHQTGLSYTASTAGSWGNLGTSVTVPRNGLMKIIVIGHVSGGTGQFTITITRGSTTYTFGPAVWNTFTTTHVSFIPLYLYSSYGTQIFTIEVPVLANDSIQLQGYNNTAGDTTSADDMVVTLQ